MYIGQTKNFINRKKQHKNALNGNHHHNEHLQNSWNKHGKDNFKFKIIQNEIKEKDIDKLEIYYINEVYDTFKGKGYNLHIGGCCQGGDNNPMYGVTGENHPRFGEKHKTETRLKMSKNHADFSGNNHPRSKISKKRALDIYREYKEKQITHRELSKKYKIGMTTIGEICKGDHWATKDKEKINGRLTNGEALSIYKEYKETNKSQSELATNYGVSRRTVSRICNHKHKATRTKTDDLKHS